jgi:beta-galactosidase/beta-glucuronidase
MKRSVTYKAILLLALLVAANVSGYGVERIKTDIGESWRFKLDILDNAPASASYVDGSWEAVNIPHTWNATDASDGGSNYKKTVGWYRKTIAWRAEYAGKRLYLEFLGANSQAECFVNGQSVGTHKGGYTAFRFDVTGKMTTGNNVIAVKVDNRNSEDICPKSGDFSFYGGLYRKAYLVATDAVHVDMMDNGASGLYLTTSDVSSASATLGVRAKVLNETAAAKTLTITAVLRHPHTFEAIGEVQAPIFDVSAMASGGAVVNTLSETVTIPAAGEVIFNKSVTISNPHLWNGKTDPYRYLVELTVAEGGAPLDTLSDYVGFRFFNATKDGGFFLNGRSYPLRGVSRHQDRKNMGNALTEREHNEDFGMMYDMGINALRLAHYPQDPYMYELCDKYGIAVWAEIPFLDAPGNEANRTAFEEVTKSQLRELIRQQYNRPSILMWGLQNEVSTSTYDSYMSVFMPALNNLAHSEDPSRLTTQAQAGTERYGWTTDLYAKNQYPGWYQSGSVGSYMDGFSSVPQLMGLSEYGAGASIYQHEIDPAQPVHNGAWHPEEYQNKVHEGALKDITARPRIWGTFVWNMFDFGSDSRNEGEQPGVNDKGLVTFDRKVKKDSYYLHKVNWNAAPEVYITSRRYNVRNVDTTPVTVYSNGESVELLVNGISQGTKPYVNGECGIFKWSKITLTQKGLDDAAKNTIVARAQKGGVVVTDTVIWSRVLSSSTRLSAKGLVVDNINLTIALTTALQAERLGDLIEGEYGATFALTEADGTTSVASGTVTVGMKLRVTAEDGQTQATYEFITRHIALRKRVVATTNESANPARNAVDGDNATRWAATGADANFITIDLERKYVLNRIAILWFNTTTSRAYKYTVEVSTDGQTFTSAVNRSANTQPDLVEDAINDVVGRYVKINVTGSTIGTAYPSIFEVQLYGWALSSQKYKVDYEASTITVPASDNILPVEAFERNITFMGSIQGHSVQGEAYYILNDDKLIITDLQGKQTIFTILVSNQPVAPDEDDRFTWSNIIFARGGAVLEDKGIDEEVMTATLVEGKEEQQWRLVGDRSTSVFVESRKGNRLYFDGKFYRAGHAAAPAEFELVANADKFELKDKAQSKGLNQFEGGGAGRKLSTYNMGDGGNTFTFAEVQDAEPTPPDVPTGLRQTDSTVTSATVSWEAVVGAAGYYVYVDNALRGSLVATDYTITGLDSGATCAVQVAAYNADGLTSEKTAVLTVFTVKPRVDDPEIPKIPENQGQETSVKTGEESLIKVYARDGYIRVEGTNAVPTVYNLMGSVVNAANRLPAGVYIVKVEGVVVKVLVNN